MTRPIRVRFAPSPTGNLHVGGARTALFNWLFARHHKGTFVLRIEDTDAERSLETYTKAILDGLTWLGIDWDEGPNVGGNHGPYFQTQRLSLYQDAAERLLKEGKVYHCFCSPERLEKIRADQAAAKQPIRYDSHCRSLTPDEIEKRLAAGEKYVLRLKLGEWKTIGWKDISKGHLSFNADLLDDLVVVKSDGFPTYNFAVVIDDVTMQITHVIRGEDHISNTPKQIMIYNALGEEVPQFAHIPMILGPDRSRLSKRHGATSVVDYKEKGFEPEAFRNYLSMLGWSSESGKEILSQSDLFEQFSLERVSTHGAIFDLEKLRWMNAEYLKTMTPAIFFDKVKPWLEQIPGYPAKYSPADLQKMVSFFRERIKTYDELKTQVEFFFKDPETFDQKGMEKVRKQADFLKLTRLLITKLEPMTDFTEVLLEAVIRGFAEENGRTASEVIGICRLAFTGKTASPGMFEMMAVLGKAKCLSRLQNFISKNG